MSTFLLYSYPLFGLIYFAGSEIKRIRKHWPEPDNPWEWFTVGLMITVAIWPLCVVEDIFGKEITPFEKRDTR